MIFPNSTVSASNIEDAWRQTMWLCVRNGHDYTVQRGSYVGQVRRQLASLSITIDEPGRRPLAVSLPEHLGFAPPTDEERIEEYFYNYLYSGEKQRMQDYTYGEFIGPVLPRVIHMLQNNLEGTNQACINIGDEHSILLQDPPCLRLVDFKVVGSKLTLSAYFRSWDLFAGLPENLGGLQLLKEYVLGYISCQGILDGPMYIYSSGAHLYEMYFPLVNQLCVDQVGGGSDGV